MKVILQKDVPKIGRKYDVKEVSDGYALNFLIPKSLAKLATKEALQKIEALQATAAADRKVQEDLIAKNLHEIDGKTVEIKAKVNDKGHLFAALHTEEIVKAIKESLGVDILPEFLAINKPLKEGGEQEIEIKVGDKKAKVKLVIG